MVSLSRVCRYVGGCFWAVYCTVLSRRFIPAADVLIPLFSFAYCGLGIMLILVSIRISSSWSQAHHHKLVELLDSFYNLPGLVGYLPYG